MELQEQSETLEKFWQVDHVANKHKCVIPKDEESTISAVSALMLIKDGNNEVQRPWKDKGALRNNYNIALKGLEKPKRDPNFEKIIVKL